jgi:hypothetical protein
VSPRRLSWRSGLPSAVRFVSVASARAAAIFAAPGRRTPRRFAAERRAWPPRSNEGLRRTPGRPVAQRISSPPSTPPIDARQFVFPRADACPRHRAAGPPAPSPAPKPMIAQPKPSCTAHGSAALGQNAPKTASTRERRSQFAVKVDCGTFRPESGVCPLDAPPPEPISPPCGRRPTFGAAFSPKVNFFACSSLRPHARARRIVQHARTSAPSLGVDPSPIRRPSPSTSGRTVRADTTGAPRGPSLRAAENRSPRSASKNEKPRLRRRAPILRVVMCCNSMIPPLRGESRWAFSVRAGSSQPARRPAPDRRLEVQPGPRRSSRERDVLGASMVARPQQDGLSRPRPGRAAAAASARAATNFGRAQHTGTPCLRNAQQFDDSRARKTVSVRIASQLGGGVDLGEKASEVLGSSSRACAGRTRLDGHYGFLAAPSAGG